jgi:heme/copper-type cytochrome/quinol oxidase subunit 3
MDEDEDDIVEVGPDGLRLVEDCISGLFGDEDEVEKGKGRYCKLCLSVFISSPIRLFISLLIFYSSARRTMGYRTDSPKPFVNATNDELQEHCLTEHAEAWETLRQTV